MRLSLKPALDSICHWGEEYKTKVKEKRKLGGLAKNVAILFVYINLFV